MVYCRHMPVRHCANSYALLKIAAATDNTALLQSVLNALPEQERAYIGELDPEKETVEFGSKDRVAALLTKGLKTKEDKQAYWLTIATHPAFRGKGLAGKLLQNKILPYVKKNNGVLYSKIKPSNKASQQWHKKYDGSKLKEDKEGWQIWKLT